MSNIRTVQLFGHPSTAWPDDAPSGKAWKCPNCSAWASLGSNAGYHRDTKKHGEPQLVDISSLQVTSQPNADISTPIYSEYTADGGGYYIRDHEGFKIAECSNGRKANLIVKAVNERDALEAVAEAVRQFLSRKEKGLEASIELQAMKKETDHLAIFRGGG